MNKFLLYPVTARCLPMIRFVPWKSDDFILCSFEGSSLTGSTATSSQLTAVRARVYCKPTYIIGGDYGKYFFYGDIDEYRDLGGRYNTANGATDDFDIDSGLKKVNIGWTSASITTVRGGTLALPSSIDTVELN